jgi:hypothetical protein
MPVIINGFPTQKDTIAFDWSYGTPYPHTDITTPRPGVVINGVNVEFRSG